ncbi:U32 family peptidase C-terminal domain-containing protein [Patescibacteria group bacterium]|nr:U32 family peptidase C-terminal domain-containing protein [Patescibacteria group bacterium]
MPTKVGDVTHFYSNIGVAIVKLMDALKVGDEVQFLGNTTDFEQTVSEMQYDHKDIESAEAGQEVGIKVSEKVREGDEVNLV